MSLEVNFHPMIDIPDERLQYAVIMGQMARLPPP